eukprot:TRINITY_DN9068_c0_g1_i11.p1 TRINITY_DN9068_c0_g1~~TRINITY_DN9068_c0_g1_i11.p1  ORF type:complete len:351 (-),score=51.40 TRINITY_DN9068_c0_g1_i11:198-1250(-)
MCIRDRVSTQSTGCHVSGDMVATRLLLVSTIGSLFIVAAVFVATSSSGATQATSSLSASEPSTTAPQASLDAVAQQALVQGFAQSFVGDFPIKHAKITSYDGAVTVYTNEAGHFSFPWPAGKPISLTLEADGYVTTTGALVMVPPQGLTDQYSYYTFQVFSAEVFTALEALGDLGPVAKNNSGCHIATTVTKYHLTLANSPQGEPGAVVSLSGSDAKPFYFGVIPGIDKTNVFERGLKSTSLDGGVVFFNIPVSNQPYILQTNKPGFKFSQPSVLCAKGSFVNAAPPQGPSVIPTESPDYRPEAVGNCKRDSTFLTCEGLGGLGGGCKPDPRNPCANRCVCHSLECQCVL